MERKIFFKGESAPEIGTSCASMNRTGKTNAEKGPKDDYNAFKEFHDRETEGHILASFMTYSGMNSMEGIGKYKFVAEVNLLDYCIGQMSTNNFVKQRSISLIRV